jgi:histidinol-phosphatase
VSSDPDLELALELADVADAITLRRFRAADLVVETKPDRTPVTEADRAVEDELRRILSERRPDHRIVGEERGEGGDGVGPRWIIDPIDATKNYLRGIPLFATLIALEDVVAVVSAPALARRWWS